MSKRIAGLAVLGFLLVCLAAFTGVARADGGGDHDGDKQAKEQQHQQTDAAKKQAEQAKQDQHQQQEQAKQSDTHYGAHDKITICHATGSATNPYVQITVSKNALKDGHTTAKGDIIPAPAGGCPTTAPAKQAEQKHEGQAAAAAQTSTCSDDDDVAKSHDESKDENKSKHEDHESTQGAAHENEHSSTKKDDDDNDEHSSVKKDDDDDCPAAVAPAAPAPAAPAAPAPAAPAQVAPAAPVAPAATPAAPATPATATPATPATPAPVAANGVLGAQATITHPAKRAGVLGAVSRLGRAGVRASLPFTGFPLWLAVFAALVLIAGGLVARGGHGRTQR